MPKPKVICIVGPTASGKTSISVELAKKLNGEIISADSMQIYKKLDIATAKVTKEEMQNIKHHIIYICDVTDNFSVADFKNMCYDKIDEILKRKKVPIIAGGTGLYISSVVYNMDFKEENIDNEFRESLYNLAKEKSNQYVHDILKDIDPESAKLIHPNNLKRVVRAIEMAKNTKKTKSEHMKDEQKRIQNENSKYNFLIFYIDHDKELLYDRINKRVDIMVDQGVVDEAKMVYDMKLDRNSTCMQAIGYKEFFPYFEGEITLEQAIEDLKKDTRKYAKRQKTWFKNKLDIICLNANEMTKEQMLDYIIKKYYD